jgi:phosphoribosylcarboxyaminoimidazole (NCAIR) mutase
VIAVPLTETALYALNAAVTASRKNLPICMVAIGGAHNAGLLAVQMLGTERLLNQVRSHKQDLRRKVLAKKIR